MTWPRWKAEDLATLAEDLELALANARRFHAVELDSLADALELTERLHTLEVEALRARLPRWYDNPRLQFLAGFITCALVVKQLE